MKALIALAFVFSSQLAVASTSLTCRSEDGKLLRWNESYGELYVVLPNGDDFLSQDQLIKGEQQFIETHPVTVVTPLVFAEDESDVFAEISEFAGTTTVSVRGEDYTCQ